MVSHLPALDEMTSNGPRVMYRVKRVHDSSLNFQKTDRMYKMKNLHGSDNLCNEDPDALYHELESRQLQVLKQLQKLSEQVQLIKNEIVTKKPELPKERKFPCTGHDVVINANVNQPPLSVWVLCNLLHNQGAKVRLSVHQHSSVLDLPQCAKEMVQLNTSQSRSSQDLSISVIWKNVACAEMMISPLSQVWIQGESNIMRYLGDCLGPSYRDLDPEIATEIDTWLDRSKFSLLEGNNKERQSFLKSLNSHLGRCKYLTESLGIADVVVWSTLCQIGLTEGLPSNVQTWFKSLTSMPAFNNVCPKKSTC